MKKIEVLVRVDSKGWLDKDRINELDFFVGRITSKIEDEITAKVVEKVMPKIELPKIKIDPKEIKSRMLDILAKRALEERE